MNGKTPNPGSNEAIKIGCQCPVLDNAHGKGYMGGAKDKDGETMFVYVVGCPVHAAVMEAELRPATRTGGDQP